MVDRVGQQFGQYRLTRFLGRGSFGEVYLGEHIHKNTLAAIKVLQARLTNEDLKEFINEASTTFRLQHPNIVRLLDFGIGPDDTPFLTMAYAPNGTLRKRHPRGTRLPPDTVAGYVKQIAAALQHAHDERLIHRDVKPENILLGPNDAVWLSDFGIAAIAHSTRSLNTERSGGTVPYMAPEQIQGKPRPASDQYALGIMTYEWLCGERPFNGTAIEIAMQHALTPPPSLREKVPTISPEVEQVVMTALTSVGTRLLTYNGHSQDVFAVAWLPNSRRIASGSLDGTVQIWDAATGAKLLNHRGHPDLMYDIALSPNGRCIALASGRKVQIQDVATGRHLYTYSGHSGSVWTVAWSPNGKRIASGSLDGTVQIWDASTGAKLLNHPGYSGFMHDIAWSPDSKCIASGSPVQIWDANTGATILATRDRFTLLYSVVWSPDGKRIASADAKETVQVWDATTEAKLLNYDGHTRSVNAMAWSPDGRHIASGSSDKTVQIWDANTGANVYTYHGHSSPVNAVAWSPDGERIASSSSDGIVHVWQAV